MVARTRTIWIFVAFAFATGCNDKTATLSTGTSTSEATPSVGGITPGATVDDGSTSIAPGNLNRPGSPAPLSFQSVRLSQPKLEGAKSVSLEYEVLARMPPSTVILVFIYTDGFDTRELDLRGLKPGMKRSVTLDLQKPIEVKYGQIDFWAGLPGGSVLVGTNNRVSNIVNVVVN